jgi:L-galactose dehydrogenase/L-glyceraldehyde 3-phosphate reductase
MEQRPLGPTGLQVSALGFGCGAIGGLMVKGDPAEQRRAIARAVEAGITYFDTAPSYGDGRSEENLGRVTSEMGTQSDRMIVGTKFRIGPEDLDDAAGAIRRSLEASLRHLRRERVHLLQLHTRIGNGAGDGTLSAEQVLGPVAEGLAALREAGLAEHAGITATGDADATRRVIESGKIETAQVYFNALNPSAGWAGRGAAGEHDFGGVIDTAAQHGVGVLVIRPLAAGALAAQETRHANAGRPGGVVGEDYQQHLARARSLAALAGELGLESPVELALRFALAKSGVSTVLVGFSDASQLEDAIRWVERGPLPADAVQRVVALSAAA